MSAAILPGGEHALAIVVTEGKTMPSGAFGKPFKT
jgi:hypothetical protein